MGEEVVVKMLGYGEDLRLRRKCTARLEEVELWTCGQA